MGLQHLLTRFLGYPFILIIVSCSPGQRIEGNWGAIDSEGFYSELYIKKGRINIFTELTGDLNDQTYSIIDDSLVTNILAYSINWKARNSMVLENKHFSLNMRRIKTGYKLSDYVGSSYSTSGQYSESFYKRLYKRKGTSPPERNGTGKRDTVKEEIIYIQKER